MKKQKESPESIERSCAKAERLGDTAGGKVGVGGLLGGEELCLLPGEEGGDTWCGEGSREGEGLALELDFELAVAL